MKKWIFRGISLVLLLTFFYFLFACGQKKAETKFVAASRGDIQEKALAVGTIEPEQEIKVKSTIPGIVAEVLFKVGDAVKEGAPLFKISPNPTPLEYVEARRAMELAEVTMLKLKADWTRQLELYKGNLLSRSEMDATEGFYEEAELRYRTSAERLELLEKGRIRMFNRDIDSILEVSDLGHRPVPERLPGRSRRPADQLPAGDRDLLAGRHGQPALQGHGRRDRCRQDRRRAGRRDPDRRPAGRQGPRPRRPHLPESQEGGQRHPLRHLDPHQRRRRHHPPGRVLGDGQHPDPREPPGRAHPRAARPVRERQEVRRGPGRRGDEEGRDPDRAVRRSRTSRSSTGSRKGTRSWSGRPARSNDRHLLPQPLPGPRPPAPADRPDAFGRRLGDVLGHPAARLRRLAVSQAQIKRFHGMGQGIVLVFPSRTTLPVAGHPQGQAGPGHARSGRGHPGEGPRHRGHQPGIRRQPHHPFRAQRVPQHRPAASIPSSS
ncbi:MAG: efflux RND transporter periplasmic adaptor subunit [Candidatus Moduliflexus flocculans]|nr:efflux RND transporter periplasmic adaptor subunit [Candidatus Moduliflexus flocculans]